MLLNQVPTIENTGVLLSWATKDTAKPFILESKSTAITPPTMQVINPISDSDS